MRRTMCGGCGDSRLHQFLDLGTSPLADDYTRYAGDPSNRYPLELAVCEACGLVQLLEVIDTQTLFGSGYSFYSSSSPVLSEYHRRYADQVLDEHPDQVKRGVLEIGCNDGDLLRWFKSPGRRTFGVDPAAGPAQVATDRGLDVMKEPFTEQSAKGLRVWLRPMGVVIANHVLAHVDSPSDTLRGIKEILATDGVAYVEVQYLPDLLVNNAFDFVYHEHHNYFSLTSLSAIVDMCGLRVMDAHITDRQQGSLRVKLAHRWGQALDVDAARRVSRLLDSEKWLIGTHAYDGFQGRVERIRTRLLDALDDARKHGSIAGYGAPAKATTLLNFCGIVSGTLDFIVDNCAEKQGRYVPGTGIVIVPPGARPLPSTFLLLSWNYARDIINNHLEVMQSSGLRWLLPLPIPMVL